MKSTFILPLFIGACGFNPAVYSQKTDFTFGQNGQSGQVLNRWVQPDEFRGSLLRDSEEVPFNREYKNVNPPIPELVKEKEYFTAITSADQVLVSEISGTKIYVPAGCFVDAEGKPVEGDVTIDYREFRDPADFMLAGIPMSFNSGGDEMYFESAGMFEINASRNGEEVFLVEGKEIQLDFNSTNVEGDCRFWSFNDSTGTWQDMGSAPTKLEAWSDGGVIQRDGENKLTQTRALKRFHNLVLKTDKFDDPTPMKERFESFTYCHNRHEMLGDKVRQDGLFNRDIRLSDLVRLGYTTSSENGEIIFEVDWNNRFHPEMAHFRGYRWKLSDPMTAREFRRTYVRPGGFSDLRLELDGSTIRMKLKDDSTFHVLSVIPVRFSDEQYIGNTEMAQKCFDGYIRALGIREKVFDKLAVRGRIRANRLPVPDATFRNQLCQSKSRRLMNKKELAMSYNEWMDYYTTIMANVNGEVYEGGGFGGNTDRLLSVSGFGYHNCDWLRKSENTIPVLALYKSPDGTPIKAVSAYVFMKRRNAVITYGNGSSYSPNSLVMQKESTSCLVVIDQNNSMHWIDGPSLGETNLSSQGSTTFVMQPIDDGDLSKIDFDKGLMR